MNEYGLIGRSLKHSFSKRYFTQKFVREGIADSCYTLFELAAIEELPALLEHHPNLRGFNVTIPYKQAVIPYLTRLDPVAERVGAVNCVKREADGWVGYNTDVEGLYVALSELLQGRYVERALVLGTGGASQAVQYALTELAIPYDLLSRDPLRGNYTYETLPVELLHETRLVINATPVGTYPECDQAPSLPYAYLTPDHLLLDLVYNPPMTAFLSYGAQRGARILNGESMLHAQAEAAWQIWQR